MCLTPHETTPPARRTLRAPAAAPNPLSTLRRPVLVAQCCATLPATMVMTERALPRGPAPLLPLCLLLALLPRQPAHHDAPPTTGAGPQVTTRP